MSYGEIQEYEGPDGEIITQEVTPTVLEAMTSAEIDKQISTAKRYPRSIKKFIDDARTLACLTPDVAQSCIYALPRGGKPIEGPSVRLAEIVAHCWGNLLVMSRISQETDRFIVAQCLAWDLEKNSRAGIEVRRKITGRDGRKFTDDMVTVTANAALSIAYRNAVWKVIPAAFYQPVYQECRRLAGGGGKSIEDRRKGVQEWIAAMKVKPAELFAFLGVKGWEDVGLDHMATLAGIITSLKDGETTIDQVFRPAASPSLPAPDGASKIDRLASTLGAQAASIPVPVASPVEAPTIASEPSEPSKGESTVPASKGAKTGKQGLFPTSGSGVGAY
jgi:hypothetical protein